MKPLNGWIFITLSLLLSLLAGVGSTVGQGGGGSNTTTATYTFNSTVPNTTVGSSSGLTIDIFNTGSKPLTINTVTLSGAQFTDYRLSGTCINGAVIPKTGAVGSQCRIQVTFTPQAAGLRSAVINATFLNALGLNMQLDGQGIPAPVATPTVIATISNIPPTTVGVPGSGRITLTALGPFGSTPTVLNTVTISGSQATDFSYFKGANCFIPIQPQNGGCTILITFTPQAAGQRSAVIDITFDNAAPLSLPLNGVGVTQLPLITGTEGVGPTGAAVSFGPIGPINFLPTPLLGLPNAQGVFAPRPSLPVGLFTDAFVVVAQGSSGAVGFSYNIIGNNPGDFVHAVSHPLGRPFFECQPNTVLPIGINFPSPQCYIGINFRPTELGPRNATLRIIPADPTQSIVDIPLSGEGLPPLPPPPNVSTYDVTGLWANAAEPGWSLGITHNKGTRLGIGTIQGLGSDALVAFWHTYDVDGRDMWLELKDGTWVDGLTYTGNLHRSTGPAFGAPYDPGLFIDSVVGTATLSFTFTPPVNPLNGTLGTFTGTLTYNVNGTTGSKTITPVAF